MKYIKEKLSVFISQITLRKLLLGFCISALLGYQGHKYFYPEVPGYCYNKQRFLTDDEFIEIAIKKALANQDINSNETSLPVPIFKSITKHKAGSLPRGVSDSDRWTANVTMKFNRPKPPNFYKPEIHETEIYTTFTTLNECGYVLDHSGGG